MKFPIFIVLFCFFISCNNTPQPNVVSGLEEPSQAELDSLKNVSANNKEAKAMAIKKSKSLLYSNNGLVGIYLGKVGNQYFKLCIDKIIGDNAEGYVVVGTEKKTVKGKILKQGYEPVPTGKLIIYRVILNEAYNPTNKGQYIITLCLSPKYNSGEGNWISGNKRQQDSIKINERII